MLSSLASPPSRRTLALGDESLRRASRAFRALSSCETEMTVLNTTMPRIMAASSQSRPPPAKNDRAAAASRTKIIGSFSWPRTWRSFPAWGTSSSWLGP